MDALMSALVKMSLRGTVIILIVLTVRFLLKKLQISHKYIICLWAMVFFYFVFPWKLNLPIGFWNNVNVPEEVRLITENLSGTDKRQDVVDGGNNVNSADSVNNVSNANSTDSANSVNNANNYIGADRDNRSGMVENIPNGTSSVWQGDNLGAITTIPAESDATMPAEPPVQDMAEVNNVERGSLGEPEVESVLNLRKLLQLLWLIVMTVLIGHMLYSYLAIKNKLLLSILYQDNVWWAENIDMPMVFGLISPQIYLPVSMEAENLDYVIAHEKMHVKRKDGLFKMFAYMVCLIHWFNPFIWIAYILLGSDMEKACDEEVIRSMESEKRKEYAYALLHIAAENGRKKKRVFVAPISFDEGNVKSRIKNIMKYKYTLPGIGAAVMIAILSLSVMFLTEAKGSDELGNPEKDILTAEGTGEAGGDYDAEDSEKVNGADYEEAGVNDTENADAASVGETETLPVFYVADFNDLQVAENFSPADYYITSRYAASNHYYIDEDGVLWGTGRNEYGQLGTGTYGSEEYHEEPVRIAEHVVSVDSGWNNYFCIYLTVNGELYGFGENYVGILLGKGSETATYSHDKYQRVTEPVLLMTDVAYARAGRECIVALKTDHTAYWWGQYAPLTNTHASGSYDEYIQGYEDYWKVEEDASNPKKMLVLEPMKIMDNCRYITTGDFTGAAISESGELYTWGSNIFGQCGTSVTEDDFVRTPIKVLDDVKMVWPDRIYFSEPLILSSEFVRWETDYDYITFILKADDTLMAAGLDIGDKEKVTEINGDMVQAEKHRYTDIFVPVRPMEYSVDYILETLSELEFGMSIEEAEEILNGAGLRVFDIVGETSDNEMGTVGLAAHRDQFDCYFDSQNQLTQIYIREGGSRDGRFTIRMSLSDLQRIVEEAGGSLTKGQNDNSWDSRDVWLYQDQEQQIQYEFYVYEQSVSAVQETAISGN